MKIVKAFSLALFFSLATNLMAQERERVPENEIKEIMSLAIDLPELQEYFHIDQNSSRIPLIIKEFGSIDSKNLVGLKKLGTDVKVLNEKSIQEQDIKAYLNIGDWTYNGNKLRLQMDYGIEGITINLNLNRINGKWEIVDSMILEE